MPSPAVNAAPFAGLVQRVLATFLAVALGALAQGYVTQLTTGVRLASIEVRLASVERTLSTITCVEVKGVPTNMRACE